MYMVVWLFEVIFATSANEVRSSWIFPACQIAFGKRLALAPTFASYMLTELKMTVFVIKEEKLYNNFFVEHLQYTWFVYHCDSLHNLRNRPN